MQNAATPVERTTMKTTFNCVLRLASTEFCKHDEIFKDTMVRKLERSCFNAAIQNAQDAGVVASFDEKGFLQLYSLECSRILSNIHPVYAFDTYLIDNLLSGKINPDTIASLKNEELNPNVATSERNEIEIRRNQKTERKVSLKYTCKKCGGNQTIPLEYQGRAADEASSRSIKCINCDHVWRS